MDMRRRKFAVSVVVAAALAWPLSALAVNCTTESEMTQATRSQLAQAARSLGVEIQAGNAVAVRAQTIAPVAAQFSGIAGDVAEVSPLIAHATLTVDSLYHLDALDLPKGDQQAQFFCSVPDSALLVTITIPDLPKGDYALAVLHATGVEHPQQLTLILQNETAKPAASPAAWKLAGLTIRPMTLAGHDGLWFWKQARVYAARKQGWAAHFYYRAARQLLEPADFFSSPNLLKLDKETKDATPKDFPAEISETAPLMVEAGGVSLPVMAMRPVSFSGALDLRVDYKAPGVTGPVETRAQMTSLVRALMEQHPGLRTAFHGFWVYAAYGNGQTFALELPIGQTE